MNNITVQRLFTDLRESLDLTLLTELPSVPIELQSKDVHRPGMALMGFTENFLPHRIQVMGESEMAYLSRLPASEQATAFARVLDLKTPALFITRDLPIPAVLLDMARAATVPVLSSSLPAVDVIEELGHHLQDLFAPRTEVHGSLADVYGVGLLFTGRSGIGKSECVLDLVERGHRLVADDIVEIVKTSDDVIVGRFREVLQHNLEIRGVGVIDVQAIFGIRAIRMQKRVEVEVHLQEWDESADYERLGLERQYTHILGVAIPRVIVPIFPGKNITVIAEVIALDFMLKIYGYDAAQALNRRIMESMRAGSQVQRYLRHDME
jgi:HPr kinase/phosphorylase